MDYGLGMGTYYKSGHISNIFEIFEKELIYGAHITALASSGLVITIYILLNLDFNIAALIVPYLIAYIIYTYNYYSELDVDKKTDPKKVEYLVSKKHLYPIIMALAIFTLLLLLVIFENIGFLIFVLIIVTGGILYTHVFKVLTKFIPGFKSIYTSSVAIYAATFFVLFYYSMSITSIFLFLFFFMFLKMLINVIFFDIKDYEADGAEKLKTFPVILGIKNTIILLHILNTVSLVILLYGIYTNVIPLYASVLTIFYIYTYYYVNKGNTTNNAKLLKYTYIIADAEFIFWPIVILLSKMFFNL
jgi:4-hydroxybenzoate polyprenyltransferase